MADDLGYSSEAHFVVLIIIGIGILRIEAWVSVNFFIRIYGNEL